MDYKLKKSEFYRIGYLLAGLFMFLFLFGILSLSSFASAYNTSTISLLGGESYCEVYDGFTYNYNVNDYSDPFTVISVRSTGEGFGQYSTNTVRGSNTVHLVTTAGDFVLTSTKVSPTPATTLSVPGVPIKTYSEFNVSNTGSSTASNIVARTYVDSISVVNGSGGNGLNASNYSDYSSYSPINSLTGGSCDSAFYSAEYKAGDPLLFSFSDLNTSNLTFNPSYMNMPLSRHNDIMCVFTFSCTSSSNPISSFVGYFGYEGVAHPFYLSDLDVILYNVSGSTYRYLCIYRTSFDLSTDFGVGNFIITGSTATPITDFSFSLLSHKYTIADYMDYVQQNWDNISPSVTDTNQNIAQSVSDIGTAQTFESGAFSDFDSSMTSSGLDTFSLSFASTPLLWCASIINTFYNNMPSGFQYLLMFVAFVGILVIVLNIAGRVVRRFGGD